MKINKKSHIPRMPTIIGSHKFDIVTDVVDSDIPLLFSKSLMKNANMKLNFQDDTITISMNTSLSSQHKADIMQSQLQKLNN